MHQETQNLIFLIANAKDPNKAVECAFAVLEAFLKQNTEYKTTCK